MLNLLEPSAAACAGAGEQGDAVSGTLFAILHANPSYHFLGRFATHIRHLHDRTEMV